MRASKVAPPPKGATWGSLKSLENYLATIIPATDARKVMGPLAGAYDLRIADAHLAQADLDKAYDLARIDPNAKPLVQGFRLIASVVSALHEDRQHHGHCQTGTGTAGMSNARAGAMLIDQVMPEFVGAKDTLLRRLEADAQAAGMLDGYIAALITALPSNLHRALCFEDKLTGLWRYEFGEPLYLKRLEQLLWGTHMWVPVVHLRRALDCLLSRVSAEKHKPFLARLDDRQKHLDVLSEMIPLLNIGQGVAADFEVAGLGNGNRTVDWRFGPIDGREIVMDVKRRSIDLIRQLDQLTPGQKSPEPSHNPAVLFRSVEKKLVDADPASRLQGVWVVTDIKQEGSDLSDAFQALDPAKVHFAILGDWERDAHILIRREEDRSFLLNAFGLQQSPRFTFQRA